MLPFFFLLKLLSLILADNLIVGFTINSSIADHYNFLVIKVKINKQTERTIFPHDYIAVLFLIKHQRQLKLYCMKFYLLIIKVFVSFIVSTFYWIEKVDTSY